MSESTITQEHRFLSTDKKKLLLLSMQGSESLGRLFQFELELAAQDKTLDFKDYLGKALVITMQDEEGSPRHFHGFISRLVLTGIDTHKGKFYYYRATLVPRLWFLTQITNCRIFQNMKVTAIIQKVLGDHGITDVETKFQGTYREWEYCVQYRESDFNFISRLMENEGIYYYFKHDQHKHTLVLCDHADAHDAPYSDPLNFRAESTTDGEVLWDWSMGNEFTSTKYALTDYNFETPSQSLLRNLNSAHASDTPGAFEVYDYPGGYEVSGEGKTYADVRMGEIDARFKTGYATSCAKELFAGAKFKLDQHPIDEYNAEYMITSIHYNMRNDTMGLGGGGNSDFTVQLTCIPSHVNYRSPRITPKPIVQGLQTALVVGPKGEEIYVDKYGRIKVQFYWDRDGKKDENSSCWVRVAQHWAGKQWGIIFNPRIGQEVIVDFLEGDPDRPLITGRVYNAEQMPPYELPANKTQSGVKTRSSTGGTPATFNEIRFEDKKGQEMLTIHAEKDQEIDVEHDESHHVGHDRTATIDHDETTQVKNNRTETVDKDETITIHGNRTETVDKDETITIHGNRTETVDKDESLTVSGGQTESITKDRSTTVSGGDTLSVSKDRSSTIGGSDTLTVSKDLTITVTKSITISVGAASISMKADGTIQIQGGASGIQISNSGIKITSPAIVDIKGAMIKNNA